MQTTAELRKLDLAGVKKATDELRMKLRKVRFEVKNNIAKNSHDISKLKKAIARAETIANEKKQEQANSTQS